LLLGSVAEGLERLAFIEKLVEAFAAFGIAGEFFVLLAIVGDFCFDRFF